MLAPSSPSRHSKMELHNRLLFTLLLGTILFLAGCREGRALSPREQFGDNKWYFLALESMQQGMESEAIGYLEKGAQKSDDFLAKKCLEELSRFGTVSQRVATAQELYKRFPDEDSLLRLSQALLDVEDYEQIIYLTTDVSEPLPVELTAIRLYALAKKNKQGMAGELEDWFFHESISQYHKEIYDSFKDTLIPSVFSEEDIQRLKIRLAVHQRDYGQSFRILAELLQGQDDVYLWLVQQSEEMLSDIGRTFLYGTQKLTDAANFLETALKQLEEGTPPYTAFYLNFYSARLYDKGLGTGSRKALEKFQAAMEIAPTPENYDNALWYYFSTQLKISTAAAEKALKQYIPTIYDPLYYGDFFETMALRYVTNRDWNGLLRCYNLIKEYADGETLSRYAYLSGRLVQLELIDLDEFPQEILDELVNVQQEMIVEKMGQQAVGQDLPVAEAVSRGLFAAAYREGGDLYYRLLASVQLGYSPAVVRQSLYQTQLLEDFQRDADVELLLEGFMAFDLPERIYPLWQEHSRSIGLEVAQKAAAHLSLYGTDLYSAQGLRLMSNAIFHADIQTTEEMYRLAYPRLYAQEIATAAQKYQLPEYLVFALIRSESFFDAVVSSHAGAVGLAQLMPATAGDIARKLKLTDYDLTNPQTSIEFGSFYLAELVGRLDGSIIEALYSYNAGITNVRNWKKYFPDLPEDLILELIPFTETRNYGKKIVSAAAIYGDLYYGVSHKDVVTEIMFQ